MDLPNWMSGIIRAVDREGARIGHEVSYLSEDGVWKTTTITEEKKYEIWKAQARAIGQEIEAEGPYFDTFGLTYHSSVGERVAEEADNHVPYGTYERWSLFTQGELWRFGNDAEFADGLRSAAEDPDDESRLPAYCLYFKAKQLIYEGMELYRPE